MKKFLLHSLLFFLILCGINGVLYMMADRLYYKNYTYHSLNHTAYLLADSHGVRLKEFTEPFGVHNFSVGSDSYFDMYRKVNYLIENTAVDTIYISVDDHTLSPYRERLHNADRSVVYSSPKDYSSYYEYIKAKYIRYYIVLFQPNVRSIVKNYLMAKLQSIVFANNGQVLEQNFWAEISQAERIKRAEDRAREQFSDDHTSQLLEQSLIDIIRVCQENDIELIGVKFPLSAEYIEMINGRTYNAHKLFEAEGLKVYDFTDVFLSNSNYFINEDHLNDEGGKAFVELLFALE